MAQRGKKSPCGFQIAALRIRIAASVPAPPHNRDVFCPFHGKGLTLQSQNIIML